MQQQGQQEQAQPQQGQQQMNPQQQQAIRQRQEQEKKKQEYENFKDQVLNNILDLNAKDRLSRIKLVKPERAAQIENYLVQQSKKQNFQNKISEDELIGLLEQISGQTSKPTVSIQRKKNALDDSF